jgi:hypothetical protein
MGLRFKGRHLAIGADGDGRSRRKVPRSARRAGYSMGGAVTRRCSDGHAPGSVCGWGAVSFARQLYVCGGEWQR